MAWTDDRVETLKKLWAEGLSASQIAKEMGGGVTRNAIIGKVHRLKLSGRATPSRPPRVRVKPVARTKPAAPLSRVRTAPADKRETLTPPIVPLEAKPLANGELATILTLTNHICKWPIGDPSSADFSFCGRKSKSGSPYCDSHASQAYQPQTRRRRRTPEGAKAVLDSLATSRRNAF